MTGRQLLTSGKKVFPIGLGCMSFAGFYGVSSEAEAHATLDRARDLGIDHMDTANVYGLGRSEEILGSYIASRKPGFSIATKAGIWRDKTRGSLGINNTPDHLRAELEGSLTRLGVERVDLYYIHRRDPELEIEEVMETMLAMKAEGKIGGIGFSEIAPATLRRAAAVGPVDAVQSEYSLWSRLPDLGMVQACAELDVAFVAFSPLGRGMLSDSPPVPANFTDGDLRKTNPRFKEPNFGFNIAQIAGFRDYARDHGVPTSALALAWCLARGPHIIPIPGTRNAEHLAEFAQGAQIEMTAQMMAEIEALLPVGWAHGDRYSKAQWTTPEGYA